MADFHKYVVSRSKTGGKFWEVEVEGDEVHTRYGKIDQDTSWTSKRYATPKKALAQAKNKLQNKLNKGYSEETELVPWDLAQRLDDMHEALLASSDVNLRIFERGEPLSKEELGRVEEAIGYRLDPRFLEFFKIANGLRVIWTSKSIKKSNHEKAFIALHHDSPCGSINIPSLEELFCNVGDMFADEGDRKLIGTYKVATLGGSDFHGLKFKMRNIDDYLHVSDDRSFYLPGLIEDQDYPDPPILMTNEYVASVGDSHPALARHYLDFIIATLGHPKSRFWLLKQRGSGGNHDLFVPKKGWLDAFPPAKEMVQFFFDDMNYHKKNALNDLFWSIFDQRRKTVKTEYAYYNKPSKRG